MPNRIIFHKPNPYPFLKLELMLESDQKLYAKFFLFVAEHEQDRTMRDRWYWYLYLFAFEGPAR